MAITNEIVRSRFGSSAVNLVGGMAKRGVAPQWSYKDYFSFIDQFFEPMREGSMLARFGPWALTEKHRSATSLMRVLDLAEGIIGNGHSSGVVHGTRLESAIALLLCRPNKVHLAGEDHPSKVASAMCEHILQHMSLLREMKREDSRPASFPGRCRYPKTGRVRRALTAGDLVRVDRVLDMVVLGSGSANSSVERSILSADDGAVVALPAGAPLSRKSSPPRSLDWPDCFAPDPSRAPSFAPTPRRPSPAPSSVATPPPAPEADILMWPECFRPVPETVGVCTPNQRRRNLMIKKGRKMSPAKTGREGGSGRGEGGGAVGAASARSAGADDDLPAVRVTKSVTAEANPRCEVVMWVANPAHNKLRKLHVKTFTHKQHGKRFALMGEAVVHEVESKKLNKTKAVQFAASLC